MNGAMEMLTDIATFTWFASLKGTVLLALVVVAQRAFGRHLSADGRYLLWLAVVISLVTPVGFGIEMPDLLPDRGIVEQSKAQSAATSEYDIPLADTPSSLQWQSGLPLLWLAGVLAVLAAMAASSRRFAALVRNGTAAPEDMHAILRECQRKAGCTSAIRLLVSTDLRAPVVSGLFRPVLLWPARLEASLSPMQLRHVLMHEVTHVKRRDIPGACIVAVVQALHWFNPAIWIAFSWLREDREMACDAATVRALGATDAHDYAHTLIQLGAMPLPTQPRLMTGLDMLDGHAQLRKRIHMLARQADPTVRHFLSPALLLAFSAFAFSQPATAPRMERTTALPTTVGVARELQAAASPEAPAASEVTAAVATIAASKGTDALPVSALGETTEMLNATANSHAMATPASAATRVSATPSVTPSVTQEETRTPQAAIAPMPSESERKRATALPGEQILVASAEPLGVLSAPASEYGIADEQDIRPATTAPADTIEALTCRNVDTSGSRIRTRLCLTQAQWDAGYKVPRSAYVRNLSTTDLLDPPPLFGL